MQKLFDRPKQTFDLSLSRSQAEQILLWLFAPGSAHAAVFNIFFLYTLLPITVFTVSLFIGKNDFFGKEKWVVLLFFGVMAMLAPYSGFERLSAAEASQSFIWPNFLALPIGAGLSLIGIATGKFFRNCRGKKVV